MGDAMFDVAAICVARSESELFEQVLQSSEPGIVDFTKEDVDASDWRYADDEVNAAFKGWMLGRICRPVLDITLLGMAPTSKESKGGEIE